MNNRLRLLRATRNWRQQDLAQRLDVSRQSVNAIETGKYDPSLPLAFRIAELFGLSIEEEFESRRARTEPSSAPLPQRSASAAARRAEARAASGAR